MSARAALEAIVAERILILDGAIGTMIQRHELAEDDFRGDVLRITRRRCRATWTC